ncbi:pheromone A receptor-domain-containing protein, partial [Mycena vulgaris]
MMGASVGLPAASLCINRRLCHLATVRTVVITTAEKRCAVLIGLLICGLFSALYVTAQNIDQGHRFDILDEISCYPALFNSLPTYLISSMWPLLIGLASGVSSPYPPSPSAAPPSPPSSPRTPPSPPRATSASLRSLSPTSSAPLTAFTIASPPAPWVSFADTHFDFGRVGDIPHFVWAADGSNRIAVEV